MASRPPLNTKSSSIYSDDNVTVSQEAQSPKTQSQNLDITHDASDTRPNEQHSTSIASTSHSTRVMVNGELPNMTRPAMTIRNDSIQSFTETRPRPGTPHPSGRRRTDPILTPHQPRSNPLDYVHEERGILNTPRTSHHFTPEEAKKARRQCRRDWDRFAHNIPRSAPPEPETRRGGRPSWERFVHDITRLPPPPELGTRNPEPEPRRRWSSFDYVGQHPGKKDSKMDVLKRWLCCR